MSVKVLGGRTYPGRFFTGSNASNHGNPAALQDMTKGTTLAMMYFDTLPAADAYIWSRAEAGQVYNAFRFTGTTLRRRVQSAGTSLDIQVTYANIPAFSAKKWVVIGCTWDLAGPTASQAIYGGDHNTPLREAPAYSVRTPGSGAIVSDISQQFRLFNRGGSANALGGVGHTVYIRRDYVAPLAEMQEIAKAMLEQVPLDRWSPTGAWVVGKTDGGPVYDESPNNVTGTLSGSTSSLAPPIVLPSRPKAFYVPSGGPAFTGRGLWFTR